jgi:uncharacterized repeat protein (TIGR01451 family)
VLALGLPHAPARAQAVGDTVLYAVNNTTTLYAVTNRTTGTTGAFATLAFAALAVARDPVSKKIYYVSGAAPIGRVAYYDPATGTNTVINSTGTAPENILRLAFNSTGVLYAVGDSARASRLYTINTATGAYTSLGSVTLAGLPFPNSGDISFDPVTGTLYATAYTDPANCQGNCGGTSGTALYSINLATRVASQIGNGFGAAATQTSLAFAGGLLYSAGGNGSLYSINKGTGAITTTVLATSGFAFQDFTVGTYGADLSVTLTASGTFRTGSSVTYTLATRNNGPYAATGTITLVDTLPLGFLTPTGSGTGWTCGTIGQIVTCTIAGPVPSASTLNPVSIVTTVGSPVASVTNTAHGFTGSTPDQNPSNNASSVTSSVDVHAVSTAPDGASIMRLPSNGTSYTQVFVVTNSGALVDSYAVAATVSSGDVTVTQVNGAAGTTATTLPVNAASSVNVTVTYTVSAAAATGVSPTLTLTATSTTVGAAAKDSGTLTITVARAGLSMAKELYRDDQTTLVSGPLSVASGEYVQYKVTISSTGSADATSVSVADVIPAQVTYVSATGDLAGWTFVKPAGTLTATLAGTLSAGTSRFFWIRVRVK